MSGKQTTTVSISPPATAICSSSKVSMPGMADPLRFGPVHEPARGNTRAGRILPVEAEGLRYSFLCAIANSSSGERMSVLRPKSAK